MANHKTLDELIDEVEATEQIYCPYCSAVQVEDDMSFPLGDCSPQEFFCQNKECGLLFYVLELAERYYHSFTQEEHDRGDDTNLFDVGVA